MLMRDANPLNKKLLPATRAMALAAGYVLLFLAVILSFEIVARKLFAISIQGVDDFGGYVLAVCTSIGVCYALVTKGHTRVDMLVTRLSGKWRAFFNMLAMVAMGGLAVFATWRCANVLMESIEFNSVATNPMQTPMWQPQSVWLAGMIVFAIVAVLYAAHAVILFFKSPAKVNAYYGFQGDPDGEAPAKPAGNSGKLLEGAAHE